MSAPDPGPNFSFIPGHQARIGDSAWDSSVGLWVDWHSGFGRDAFVARRKSTERPAMSAKMTLEEIEALAKSATPGPWRLETGDAAPIGNVETIDGHLVLQAQQNLTVKGSDYVGQNAMRNANARFAAQVWRLLEICREQAEALQVAETAMRDMLCGWRQIREGGGEDEIYGIGWDRAQKAVEDALSRIGTKK